MTASSAYSAATASTSPRSIAPNSASATPSASTGSEAYAIRSRPVIETSARSLLAAAGAALLDDRRSLSLDELGDLAALPDRAVPALASLAHEVRLAWCGPEVEVEGILSAKTGGCPEDCNFCSQSAQFDTPVKATPFLDADEIIK